MNPIEWSSRWWWVPVAALGLTACADGAGPNGRGRLALSVSTRSPTSSPSASTVLVAGDSTRIVLGSDTVVIDTVGLVFRNIKLKPVESAQCQDNDDAADDAADANDATEADDEGCEGVRAGPVLVSLPLGAVPTEVLVDVSAPAGQYDRLEFKIHAPKDSPADLEFLAAHPEFAGVSVRVTGIFSKAGTRTRFTFLSDLTAEQKVAIDPPVDVTAGGTASVTVRFDVSGWFLNAAADALVDPATANAGGPNESVVAENIQRSIDAFEDDDHDGHDDDDPADDDDGGTNGDDGDVR
ncbi:MAG: hypothetical protein ACREMF_11590 [Gemmatimonadales bacterium]